jgi:hypothetical protein
MKYRFKLVSILAFILFVQLALVPYMAIAASTTQTQVVNSLTKFNNDVGEIYLQISNTSKEQLEHDIKIYDDALTDYPFTITEMQNTYFHLKIEGATINHSYHFQFSEAYILPIGTSTNFDWTIHPGVSEIQSYHGTLPQYPVVNEPFQFAIYNEYPNLDTSLYHFKALDEHNNPAEGTLHILSYKALPFGYIVTASYDRNERINIKATIGEVTLENNFFVYLNSEDQELNDFPKWFVFNGFGYSVQNDGLHLQWTAAEDRNGIKKYNVKVNDTVVNSVSSDVYDSHDDYTKIYSYLLTDLNEADTQYKINIEAENSIGNKTTHYQDVIYKTPVKGEIDDIAAYSNWIGRFSVRIFQTSNEEFLENVKISYMLNGEKRYADYSIQTYLDGDDSNQTVKQIFVNEPMANRTYSIEVNSPLTIKESVMKSFNWAVTAEMLWLRDSKAINENENFMFAVKLNTIDSFGGNASVFNTSENTFHIETTSGSILLKKVEQGSQLPLDNPLYTSDESIFYITANFKGSGPTDIVTYIGGVRNVEVISNIKVNRSPTLPTGGFGPGPSFGLITPEETPKPIPAKPPIFSSVVPLEKVLTEIKTKLEHANNNPPVVFKDIDNQSWSFSDISAATKLRIINGFEDGSFKPNDSVTRAEFTAMVVRAFGLSQGKDITNLNDIKDSWAKTDIEILASNGIISGYAGNSYQPGRNISRAEMITILSRIINLKELKSQSSKTFSDVNQNYWAKDTIEDATSAGIIQGSDTNAFSPDNQATRAESISVIMRALKSIPEIQALIVEL